MPSHPNHSKWIHHWQDEIDASYLYETLSELEQDTQRQDIYQRLSKIEIRHAEAWEKVFRENELTIPNRQPSARAKLQAWAARRFGPGFLLSMLVREEGAEVKKYLALHKSTGPSSAKDMAFLLAKESAEHASTLRDISGLSGEPWHQAESGELLRNVVYGFNDGLTANFGLVAGVLGADVSSHVIILSGFAGMVADALSMGSSGYLASVSQREVYENEIAMEREEMLLMPEVEEQELALIYEAKGIEPERAQQMAHEIMKDPQRALDEQVREELKIGELNNTPVKDGLVTGTATLVGAFIPVAPFLVMSGAWAIWTSFLVSMLAHFGVGAARSLFTGRGIFRSGWDMFLVGFGVAAVGYFLGDVFVKWVTG